MIVLMLPFKICHQLVQYTSFRKEIQMPAAVTKVASLTNEGYEQHNPISVAVGRLDRSIMAFSTSNYFTFML